MVVGEEDAGAALHWGGGSCGIAFRRDHRPRRFERLRKGLADCFAIFGVQITRNIFSEVGYRYLYDDFRDTPTLPIPTPDL